MRYRDRTTVCVSSQAGCAMGCTFCATGDAGFGRQLSSGEIVEQVVIAARRCRSEGWGELGNVVLMGMGEPLANFKAVWAAVESMNQDLGLAARHLTISTVGVVPGIRRLRGKTLQVNLAVSLHAGQRLCLRDGLVPLNRKYPLCIADGGLRRVPGGRPGGGSRSSGPVSQGVNDTGATPLSWLARAAARGAREPDPAQPDPGRLSRGLAGSDPARVAAFQSWLIGAGVNTTIRQNRGRPIAAACGQLAASSSLEAPRRRRGSAEELASFPHLSRDVQGFSDGDEPCNRSRAVPSGGVRPKRPRLRSSSSSTGPASARRAPACPFSTTCWPSSASHGGLEPRCQARGDLEVDAHHTVEDTGIVLGEALAEALGDQGRDPPFRLDRRAARRGARRGRPRPVGPAVPALRRRVRPRPPPLGSPPFEAQLAEEFWRAFAHAAALTLHIELRRRAQPPPRARGLASRRSARALRDAVRVEGGRPSRRPRASCRPRT